MASLSYFVHEATLGLRRGRGSTALAIVTIALALFVLGAFLLVTASLDRLMASWGTSAEMSVYLAEDASDEQRAAVDTALAGSPLVAARQFVSKAEAARRFRQDFPDLATAADGLGGNPFPASFEVRLRGGRSTPIAQLAGSIARLAGVADVRYDQQWLERLARVVGVVRAIGFALAAGLAIAAGLTVAAVVRLGMFARRDEVEIMALVGAPMSAIRGPFVVEGVLQGGIGAVVALLALRVAYAVARARVAAHLPGFDASPLQFLAPLAVLAIVVGGMIVGCVGGLIATRTAR